MSGRKLLDSTKQHIYKGKNWIDIQLCCVIMNKCGLFKINLVEDLFRIIRMWILSLYLCTDISCDTFLWVLQITFCIFSTALPDLTTEHLRTVEPFRKIQPSHSKWRHYSTFMRLNVSTVFVKTCHVFKECYISGLLFIIIVINERGTQAEGVWE